MTTLQKKMKSQADGSQSAKDAQVLVQKARDVFEK